MLRLLQRHAPRAEGSVQPEFVPVLDRWMEHARGCSANTIRAYGDDARMFLAFCDRLGIVYAEQVGHQVIEGFGSSLHALFGQKESSVNRRTAALRSLFLSTRTSRRGRSGSGWRST